MSANIQIFTAYSHRDEEMRDRLAKFLKPLEGKFGAKVWHDRRIKAGEPWDDVIRGALLKSHIILLLVSADFLSSSYCMEEEFPLAMQQRESKGVKVIPVILSPCCWEWHEDLASLQFVPKDGKPVELWEHMDSAWRDIAIKVGAAASDIKRRIKSNANGAKRKEAGANSDASRHKKLAGQKNRDARAGKPSQSTKVQRSPRDTAAITKIVDSTIGTNRKTVLSAVKFWSPAVILGIIGYLIAKFGILEADAFWTRADQLLTQPPSPETQQNFRTLTTNVVSLCLPFMGAVVGLLFNLRNAKKTSILSKNKVDADPITRTKTKPRNEAEKWRNEARYWNKIANRFYHRHAASNEEFERSQARFGRLRSMLATAIAVAILSFVHLFLSPSEVESTDIPWLLYGMTGGAVAVITYLYVVRPNSYRNFFTAFLVGGVGALLSDLLFLLQVGPLVWKANQNLNDTQFLSQFVGELIYQKILYLPLVGLAASLLVVLVIQRTSLVDSK